MQEITKCLLTRILLGVDLGKSGGLCFINENQQISRKIPMPVIKAPKGKLEYNIQAIINVLECHKPDFTYIEKAMIIPITGRIGVFSNGRGMGLFEGILSTLKLRYDIIQPQRWQKNIFAGMPYKDTKQASELFCRRMYPNENWLESDRCKNPHSGMMDACCIAVYNFRMNNGQ